MTSQRSFSSSSLSWGDTAQLNAGDADLHVNEAVSPEIHLKIHSYSVYEVCCQTMQH